MAAEQAPTSTSSVDDDGYALWRYLACQGHPTPPLNETGTKPQEIHPALMMGLLTAMIP